MLDTVDGIAFMAPDLASPVSASHQETLAGFLAGRDQEIEPSRFLNFESDAIYVVLFSFGLLDLSVR